jgi:hypothetical protein
MTGERLSLGPVAAFLFAVGASICLGIEAASGAEDDAVAAVRAWYQVAEKGSDQSHLLDYGTVGGGPFPLTQAYGMLAPSLRSKMTEPQFFEHFRGLAQVRLLQAHAIHGGQPEQSVQVFVEEQRTLVMQGVPAVAWFQGLLTVSHTPAGWRIADLSQVKPENIISFGLGGHQPWVFNPEDVALVNTDQACCANGSPDCREIGKTVAADGETAEATTRACGRVYRARLTKLHSGVWVFLDKALLPNEAPH